MGILTALIRPSEPNTPPPYKSMGAMRDLLLPALRAAKAYAGRNVKEVDLFIDHVEDTLDLAVRHKLFSRQEIEDGSFKLSFRSRVEAAMLSAEVPNGRRLTVERRSFLARGARIRKAKPKKARKK